MAIRPYLADLIGDTGAMEAHIVDLLAADPVNVDELLVLFTSRPELQNWFGQFVEFRMPPDMAIVDERSGLPGDEPPPLRAYVCPRGDYLRFDRVSNAYAGECTTHHGVILSSAERIVLAEQQVDGASIAVDQWVYGSIDDAGGPAIVNVWTNSAEDGYSRGGVDVVSDWIDRAEEASEAGSPEEVVGPEESETSTTDRQVNGWLEGAEGGVDRLRIQVGEAAASTLFVGEISVRAGEIPPQGLETRWLLSSSVPLHTVDDLIQVEHSMVNGAGQWTATFALTIPAVGPSEERVLEVELGTDAVEVGVVILAPAGVYRYLTLRLPAREGHDPSHPIAVYDDRELVSIGSAGLRPPHEWASPAGRLTLIVDADSVAISADWFGYSLANRDSWTAAAALAGLTDKVRLEAERLRAKASDHLDNIPADAFEAALTAGPTFSDWNYEPHLADQEHEDAWSELSQSDELRGLAGAGYTLYQALFPEGTLRRTVLDAAPVGALVEIVWTVDTPGAVGGIPWTFLCRQPPRHGTPVDMTSFLGLSHRVAHIRYSSRATSLFLGDPATSHLLDVLFWGEVDEPAAIEARWQRTRLESLPNHVIMPSVGSANPRAEVCEVLDTPAPAPVPCLYLFCEHDAGTSGNAPRMRFGSGRKPEDLLDDTAFGFDQYPDGPLVFANACSTSSAAAYLTPLLEQRLFQNGCRAYIGTETKVPVVLASRLGRAFFHFFEQRVDGYAMPAGEALSLTRRWLWQHFRNPGGLFYCYVNQYRLVLADVAEAGAVRR